MVNNFRRIKQCLLRLFFVCCFLKVNMISSYAEISLIGLTEEEAKQHNIWAAPRKIREELLYQKPVRDVLVTEQWVAIEVERNMVGVYDLQGNYLYSVAITSDGGCLLYYDREMDRLIVVVSRTQIGYSFDSSGELVQMESWDDNKRKRYSVPDKIDKAGREYYISSGSKWKDVFSSGTRSKVLVKNKEGEESVFWDSGLRSFRLATEWKLLLFMIIFALCRELGIIQLTWRGEKTRAG